MVKTLRKHRIVSWLTFAVYFLLKLARLKSVPSLLVLLVSISGVALKGGIATSFQRSLTAPKDKLKSDA